VEEQGRSANFTNQDRTVIRKIRVDGCLITTGVRCDWILSHPTVVDVLIELKGTDVNHALEQLERTIEVWLLHPERIGISKLSALVVCSQYPRFNTTIARKQQEFAERFRAPLRVKSRNQKYDFGSMAAF
jgi:hypothetical protein